jgi:hypothetical protein
MWETAEKAGVVTANLMWPGPPKTKSGASSTYFVPWKVSPPNHTVIVVYTLSLGFQDKVPLSEKLDQILQWVDLPLEKRPQLIMGDLTSIYHLNDL